MSSRDARHGGTRFKRDENRNGRRVVLRDLGGVLDGLFRRCVAVGVERLRVAARAVVLWW